MDSYDKSSYRENCSSYVIKLSPATHSSTRSIPSFLSHIPSTYFSYFTRLLPSHSETAYTARVSQGRPGSVLTRPIRFLTAQTAQTALCCQRCSLLVPAAARTTQKCHSALRGAGHRRIGSVAGSFWRSTGVLGRPPPRRLTGRVETRVTPHAPRV